MSEKQKLPGEQDQEQSTDFGSTHSSEEQCGSSLPQINQPLPLLLLMLLLNLIVQK